MGRGQIRSDREIEPAISGCIKAVQSVPARRSGIGRFVPDPALEADHERQLMQGGSPGQRAIDLLSLACAHAVNQGKNNSEGMQMACSVVVQDRGGNLRSTAAPGPVPHTLDHLSKHVVTAILGAKAAMRMQRQGRDDDRRLYRLQLLRAEAQPLGRQRREVVMDHNGPLNQCAQYLLAWCRLQIEKHHALASADRARADKCEFIIRKRVHVATGDSRAVDLDPLRTVLGKKACRGRSSQQRGAIQDSHACKRQALGGWRRGGGERCCQPVDHQRVRRICCTTAPAYAGPVLGQQHGIAGLAGCAQNSVFHLDNGFAGQGMGIREPRRQGLNPAEGSLDLLLAYPLPLRARLLHDHFVEPSGRVCESCRVHGLQVAAG